MARWRRASLQPRAEFAEPPRLAETRMTIVRPDAKVPLFSRIYRVPSYAQAAPGQAEGLETLAQMLGGDQTAALYRMLVEQKKLATDAGANYDGYARDAGEFSRLCRAAPRRVAWRRWKRRWTRCSRASPPRPPAPPI